MTRIPTVSIIIPFYNNVQWLIEAIDSVFSQTFKDYEIIVVNDGSPEDISEFLEKYGSQIIYRWKLNAGPGPARNLGIEIASGKYIAFLDSDDLWSKQKLEKQVKLMEESNIIWSHTNYTQFYENNPEKFINYDLKNYSGNIFPQSLVSTHIATPSVMLKADFLKKRPDLRFNDKMRFGQDYYFWLLLSMEIDLILVPEVLCKVRIQGNNASKRARVHLQVRSQIWQHLRYHSSRIFYQKNHSVFIRIVYRICFLENKFVVWLENKNRLGSTTIEYLSKIIYAFPYYSFTILHYFIKQNN